MSRHYAAVILGELAVRYDSDASLHLDELAEAMMMARASTMKRHTRHSSSGDVYADGQLLLSSGGRWMPLEGDMNFKAIVVP